MGIPGFGRKNAPKPGTKKQQPKQQGRGGRGGKGGGGKKGKPK